MTGVIARLRSQQLRRRIEAVASLYATPLPDPERESRQLELLNRAWLDVRTHVPHYAELSRERGGLPERWESLEQFVANVPSSNRETLQQLREQLVSRERSPQSWAATGGSTAQPIQIPRWKSEAAEMQVNQWLGRAWQGVAPHDRLFLLWGHSHLLGSGLRGWVNARRREAEDRLLGYCRFSAYDLSDAAMQAAVARIFAFRPDYIVGYSVALDRLERVAAEHRARLHDLGIKVVIGTAEAFPYPDSAGRLSATFGCPVAMEYGAVEALGLAHTHPEGGYRLFWHSYLAEAERRQGRWVLRLTSLYPRSLPLVRYEIGDEVEIGASAPDRIIGLTRFERLLGRCNDYVTLTDGTLVHSEAISHAVRPCPSIRGYQVVQNGERRALRVRTAARGLPAEEEAGLRSRLGRVHAELERIPIEVVDTLEQTLAGKTPMIIRR